MYDFHVHTHHSLDSDTPMVDICRSALEKKIKGICFTDHVDLFYANPLPYYDINYNSYKNEIAQMQATFAPHLTLFRGVELGLQPHIAETNTEFLKDKDFDFVLGSLHCVGQGELYGLDWLHKRGLTDVEGINLYFSDLAQCVRQLHLYDVIGHFDVFRRYLIGDESNFIFAHHKEQITEILQFLIDNQKGIEINTSTLRYGLKPYHPCIEILELYRELGGTILTLGSDSHRANTLATSFLEVQKLLKEIGFTHYSIFVNRQVRFIPL